MSRLAYEYKSSQFDLTGGDIELHFCPTKSGCEAIHQMFEMHSATAFEQRDRETRDERYARWGLA